MINIEERVEKAMRLFKEGGYNCCQAVVLAYNDMFGIDDTTAAALSSGFGGGMGRMREVCGAVSGMAMVLGVLYGHIDPKVPATKADHYVRVREVADAFRAETGSIICRDLIAEARPASATPAPRDAAYYQKRPCAELVALAADICARYIDEHPVA